MRTNAQLTPLLLSTHTAADAELAGAIAVIERTWSRLSGTTGLSWALTGATP
jgi:hypothetical protein